MNSAHMEVLIEASNSAGGTDMISELVAVPENWLPKNTMGKDGTVSHGNLSEVTVGVGSTLNMGNYNSARFYVEIKAPVALEEVDVAFAQLKEWAEAKINGMMEEAKSGGVE